MFGVSYDGLTTAMTLLQPHPALKAISEQASPVDQWMNDDDHRYGALRESYDVRVRGARAGETRARTPISISRRTTPTSGISRSARSRTSTRSISTARFRTGTTTVEHPDYDAFWKTEAWVTQLHASTVPNLNVAGFWDQEDPWGPWQIFRHAAEARSRSHELHGGRPVVPRRVAAARRTTASGSIPLGGHETAREFREKIEAPFFRYYLHGKGEKPTWQATTFQTGSNSWQTYAAWPPRAAKPTNLYLHADGTLSFDAAERRRARYREYVSDPAQPGAVPPAPDLADISRRRLAHVGGRRPAVRRRPARTCSPTSARRSITMSRSPVRSSADAVRVDVGHGRRLHRQADRRLPRERAAERVEPRRRTAARPVRAIAQRLRAADRDGGAPRPLPHELRDAAAARAEHADRVGDPAARPRPRVPQGTPASWCRCSRPGSR